MHMESKSTRVNEICNLFAELCGGFGYWYGFDIASRMVPLHCLHFLRPFHANYDKPKSIKLLVLFIFLCKGNDEGDV